MSRSKRRRVGEEVSFHIPHPNRRLIVERLEDRWLLSVTPALSLDESDLPLLPPELPPVEEVVAELDPVADEALDLAPITPPLEDLISSIDTLQVDDALSEPTFEPPIEPIASLLDEAALIREPVVSAIEEIVPRAADLADELKSELAGVNDAAFGVESLTDPLDNTVATVVPDGLPAIDLGDTVTDPLPQLVETVEPFIEIVPPVVEALPPVVETLLPAIDTLPVVETPPPAADVGHAVSDLAIGSAKLLNPSESRHSSRSALRGEQGTTLVTDHGTLPAEGIVRNGSQRELELPNPATVSESGTSEVLKEGRFDNSALGGEPATGNDGASSKGSAAGETSGQKSGDAVGTTATLDEAAGELAIHGAMLEGDGRTSSRLGSGAVSNNRVPGTAPQMRAATVAVVTGHHGPSPMSTGFTCTTAARKSAAAAAAAATAAAASLENDVPAVAAGILESLFAAGAQTACAMAQGAVKLESLFAGQHASAEQISVAIIPGEAAVAARPAEVEGGWNRVITQLFIGLGEQFSLEMAVLDQVFDELLAEIDSLSEDVIDTLASVDFASWVALSALAAAAVEAGRRKWRKSGASLQEYTDDHLLWLFPELFGVAHSR